MSPIKGITTNVAPAFPRLGKLRKGAQRTDEDKSEKRPGKELRHWRFTSDRPEVEEAFRAAYGDSPALVNAYLPYRTTEQNFQSWKEKWTAGGLAHRCDGETMVLWLNGGGRYSQEPKACDGGCDEVGRLIVIIPELVMAGFVGYVTCETHGINDLLSIQASLLAAQSARADDLRGIPFTLRRQAEKISTPAADGKRARREKWLIKIEPAWDWVQLQLQAARAQAMGMLEAPRAATIPAARPIDSETGDIVEGEAREMPVDLEPEPPTEDYTSEDAASDPEQPEAPPADDMLADAESRLLRVCQKLGRTVAASKTTYRKLSKLAPDAVLTVEQIDDLITRLRTAAKPRTTNGGGAGVAA